MQFPRDQALPIRFGVGQVFHLAGIDPSLIRADASEEQIHHQRHHHQKQHGHDAASLYEIRDTVTCRPHDQGVDLMGGDEEGAGDGNGHGQREDGGIASGADGDIDR